MATAHADAIAVQIRVLRLRQIVLAAAAERGSTPEEMDLMHQLAKLSEQDRRALITTSSRPSSTACHRDPSSRASGGP